MGLVVQKYGGTSVGSVERIQAVAQRVIQTIALGHQVVVVVSAMGKTTDGLVSLAKEITPEPDRREMDMLLATGEQVSIALVTMALHALHQPARSMTGAQAGVVTEQHHGRARILEIKTDRIHRALDQGKVVVEGQVRKGLIEDQKRSPFRISLVFQQAALFDSLTIGENVGFLLYQHSRLPHRRIRDLVSESLEKVGLHPDTAEKYPSQLSGGMRKRVSIARAIMEDPENDQDDPELILYDEPTAGLDPVASTLIEDLMRDLKEK